MWLPVGNDIHLSTDFEGNDIINLFPVLGTIWFSVLETESLDKVQVGSGMCSPPASASGGGGCMEGLSLQAHPYV